MKKSVITAFLLAALAISSCGNNSSKEYSSENLAQEIALEDVAATSAAPEALEKREITSQNKKIIKTGEIVIESKDIFKTKESLDKIIESSKAYYEQENITTGSTYSNYNFTIRIPFNSFDSFIQKLEKGNDKISSKSIQAQDVSIQFLDIESRLKSKKAYLERYQEMVKSAKTTKDLLEIEEQIRQLQEDIESNSTLLRSLSDQVNYSTLTIRIHYAESGNITQPNSFFREIGDSLQAGWSLIKSITLGLVSIWPILILIIASYFGWKRLRKNKNKSKQD